MQRWLCLTFLAIGFFACTGEVVVEDPAPSDPGDGEPMEPSEPSEPGDPPDDPAPAAECVKDGDCALDCCSSPQPCHCEAVPAAEPVPTCEPTNCGIVPPPEVAARCIEGACAVVEI